MDPARERKVEPLPSSLLGRQSILVVTTSHEINPLLALRQIPPPTRARALIKMVQPSQTLFVRDRWLPPHRDSTPKQNKGCITGRAKHLGGTTQNVIITITGVIVIIMITTGGVTIATLSFLLAEAIGAGMTDGGIPPGDTIHSIPITIITARSMAMTACNQTR